MADAAIAAAVASIGHGSDLPRRVSLTIPPGLIGSDSSMSDKLLPEATVDNATAASTSESPANVSPSVIRVNNPLARSEPVLPSAAPKLRRILTLEEIPFRGHEWTWLSNVAFLVAAAFIVGSLLFIIGTCVVVFNVEGHENLVACSYFIGGTYFLLGAYAGHVEVINVGCGQRRLLAWPSQATSISGYWGSLFYFIGAVTFEVAVVFDLFAPAALKQRHLAHLLLDSLPQAIGGLSFTIAAVIECYHNADATPEHRVWWLCLFYLLGSVLFCLAASTGAAAAIGLLERSTALERWGIGLPYLLGSIAFLFGGWMQMRMWKAQQFGLGFVREVNAIFTAFAKPIDLKQQLSIGVYTTTVALCALNLALNHSWHERVETVWSQDGHIRFVPEVLTVTAQAEELFTDISGLVASHGMLLVATVVHQTPDLHPFDYLLWVMRGVSVTLLASAGLRCARYLDEAGAIEAYGAGG